MWGKGDWYPLLLISHWQSNFTDGESGYTKKEEKRE